MLPGDGWRSQHDAIKWRIYEDLREMGVRVRTDVFGLLTGVPPAVVRDELGRWAQRKQQGLVPDFLIGVSLEGGAADRDTLYELKTLHAAPTTYPPRQTQRCAATRARGDKLPGEYADKARRLDRKFYSTGPGELGPAERRILSFGGVRGLVFGHWGEATPHTAQLMGIAAEIGAQRHWRAMRARTKELAFESLHWLLRRRWGMTALRANARLVLERLEYVGAGNVAAGARRTAARANAAAARRSAYWHYQGLRRPSAWARH